MSKRNQPRGPSRPAPAWRQPYQPILTMSIRHTYRTGATSFCTQPLLRAEEGPHSGGAQGTARKGATCHMNSRTSAPRMHPPVPVSPAARHPHEASPCLPAGWRLASGHTRGPRVRIVSSMSPCATDHTPCGVRWGVSMWASRRVDTLGLPGVGAAFVALNPHRSGSGSSPGGAHATNQIV